MKIILAKAYAGTVYSGTNELSWEKKAPLRCCNCFCSGTFCALEMLKSQPFLILLYQQKLLLAVGLLQTYPGRDTTLEESRARDDKMQQESIARAGGVVGCFQQSQLPGGLTCPSGPRPDADICRSKLEVSALGPKNAKGTETSSEAAQGHLVLVCTGLSV